MLSAEKLLRVDEYRTKFVDAVSEDLNTAQALAVVWEVVKSNIPATDKYDLLIEFDEVLGLGLDKLNPPDGGDNGKLIISEEIQKLAQERGELRKEKKFAEADLIRQKIEHEGYSVEDGEEGPRLRKLP